MAPWRQPTMQPPQRLQTVRSGPFPPKNGSGTVSPGLSPFPSRPKKTATFVDSKPSSRPICLPISRMTSSGAVRNGVRVAPSIRSAVR